MKLAQDFPLFLAKLLYETVLEIVEIALLLRSA
jgi:hypothetical protein